MSKQKRVVVDVIEKVHRTYVSSRSHKTSAEDIEESDAARVEIFKRHYCTYCKRKRGEIHMRICGTAAFGKAKWCCIDQGECLAVVAAKKRARTT